MTAGYEYGTFAQYTDDTDDDDNYLYTLRQFVMMRRCGRPFSTWEEVMDYTAEWFGKNPDLDPGERKPYSGWASTKELWVF